MIDRIVYLGPYNNSKAHKLFNKAINYLMQDKGNNFYYTSTKDFYSIFASYT